MIHLYIASYYTNILKTFDECWRNLVCTPCLTSLSFRTDGDPNYTGCPRRNVPDFGGVFLMLNYTDITQNTYVQS